MGKNEKDGHKTAYMILSQFYKCSCQKDKSATCKHGEIMGEFYSLFHLLLIYQMLYSKQVLVV